ncbi:uncharacterized protein [Primulina eburnea]|uniref:uncharacterized protein n=1 Tax=Primulina eburnea TaxID=1245227 RepID=UPI003C6C5BB8
MEYKEAKVPIWWDMKSCPLPAEFDISEIKNNIELSLRRLNYTGTISISAYGNFDKITQEVVDELQFYGIEMIDIPSDGKDSVEKRMLVDVIDMGFDEANVTPNRMLISADEEFSDLLQQLKMRNYNILLAHPSTRPLQLSSSLVCAANTIWTFKSLLKGEVPL